MSVPIATNWSVCSSVFRLTRLFTRCIGSIPLQYKKYFGKTFRWKACSSSITNIGGWRSRPWFSTNGMESEGKPTRRVKPKRTFWQRTIRQAWCSKFDILSAINNVIAAVKFYCSSGLDNNRIKLLNHHSFPSYLNPLILESCLEYIIGCTLCSIRCRHEFSFSAIIALKIATKASAFQAVVNCASAINFPSYT